MPERTVAFKGREFALADSVGLMPLMRFAHIAKGGVDSADLEGLVAMYDLLRDCFTPEAWEEFQDHATATKAQADELFGAVSEAIAVIAARPTGRPSDSSGGPSTTSTSSPAGSSSPVVRRLEEQRRPDLALLTQRAIEARDQERALPVSA